MKIGFRWFGDDDYNLSYIRHIPNTTEVIWSLHQKKAGELWEEKEIINEIKKINNAGLMHHVVESVNIHESIKIGSEERDKYITNYIKTLENLGKNGVKVVCYNFMPIFDWTRTELYKELEDGSTSMYFDNKKISNINPLEFKDEFLNISKDYDLPGWEKERLEELSSLFNIYNKMSVDQLWENLKYFIDKIIPTCEKFDIKMAIHPDDPGFEIFGLPRMIATKNDIERLYEINESLYNGLTFCTGSLGSNSNNNLVELLNFSMSRIHFVHLRNIKFLADKEFQEVSHFEADGDVPVVSIMRTLLDNNYEGYLRPDHGRHIFGEICRPGYGMYDRAFGIMYINGIIDGYRLERANDK